MELKRLSPKKDNEQDALQVNDILLLLSPLKIIKKSSVDLDEEDGLEMPMSQSLNIIRQNSDDLDDEDGFKMPASLSIIRQNSDDLDGEEGFKMPTSLNIFKKHSDDLDNEDGFKMPISLNIIKQNSDDLDEEDGCKTPTSLDQRLPLVPLQCPPAPSRPKPTAMKRKASLVCSCRRKLLFDVSIASELETFIPDSFISRDLGAIKVKKTRKNL